MSIIGLFGAAGAIGKSVAVALRAESRSYRAVGRSRVGLEQAFGDDPLADIATWDLNDPASIRNAAQGVDTLVYLVGVPYNHFELHPQLIRKTLAGAIAEGVRRLILIGTVYPFGRAQTARVSEDHPREPHTFKGRMRKEQEDLVIEAGNSGKIQTAILRLPDFYGPGVENSFLFRVFKAAFSGGTADLIGPIDVPHEFVFVPDVGPVVLRLADADGAFGRTWNLGGAGTITQRDFAERVFRAAGSNPKLRVAGKNMLRLMGLFNPFMRELVEMQYLFSGSVIMDDSALTKLLGGIAKTSYDEGIRRTLQEMQYGIAL
jgi:nucleoside-diphosphate-sugar epimerase